MSYSRNMILAAAMLAAAPLAACATTQSNAAMERGSVVDVAVGSPQHTTLVAAVQAAGLVDTLSGAGPFTLFAPVDDAFRQLPAGTVQSLLRPENRAGLQGLLTYHVVPGRVTASDLVDLIRQGGGTARLVTVQGGSLTARLSGSNVILTDARGGTATVVAADLAASNGVVHATDAVSMPG